MKKYLACITALSLSLMLLAGCGAPGVTPAGSSAAASAKPAEATAAPKAQGTLFETDKFSLMVPEGWEKMDVDGGVQLYKTSGEVIEVHFRGSNMNQDEAQRQVESTASQYNGTAAKEVDFLGRKFWTTSFTSGAGVPQVTYLAIEDGVMLSVKAGGPAYDTNPEFQAILESIVFK
jgi:hypothetical protein